ncbi:MAG: putative dsRNA-binding protein [Saprospiraceae bacterium]|nr:putative dsRNA-binding protein [Saprospiraceae bacterium]
MQTLPEGEEFLVQRVIKSAGSGIGLNAATDRDRPPNGFLEALVGAIYLEKGYKETRHIIVTRILRSYLNIHALEKQDDNFKSQLLEWCQKTGREVDYRLKQKYKFEKRDRFRIAVVVNGKEVAMAEDFSKKSAEQTASKKAIKALGIHENGIS